MIYKLGEHEVQITGEDFYVAESASVIGKVRLANDTSVWFGAVLRGDNESITVGENTNIQECAVIHTDPGFPCILGSNVTIGHQAMLHGCQVGDNSLIGINAVVLNGAKIGRNCLIGANALVTENQEIPDGSLVIGSPAKPIKQLTTAQIQKLKESAEHYVTRFKRFKRDLSVDSRFN
ncbi:MAG: gamma carbonic anhydrase family protein [Gammaproteobacteria bacterium]|nr:gamma carbonic anhydrase family protein [Gammaproteobacteria bacterium]|tara:strand:- start:1048 stop:1581 length:534 start_codon:yes stop_codon:yes gene_type:complete